MANEPTNAENTDLSQVLLDAARAPKSVTTDGGSVTAHSLSEMVALDEHVSKKRASLRCVLRGAFVKVNPWGNR